MKRAEILDAAREAVTVDRANTHGPAEDTFSRIAGVWTGLTGRFHSPEEVALMLAALKMARAWGNPEHADNWIDLAGYAACGGELADGPHDPVEVCRYCGGMVELGRVHPCPGPTAAA